MLRAVSREFYRLAARGTGWILAANPAVQSVLAHRSTATGEIDFARSDIDLIVRLNDHEATAERILSLVRLFRTVKYANIALGEVETHRPQEWFDWFEVDSYRGSMERRSALCLYGQDPPRPFHKVQPSHAIRRFVLWFHDHAFVAWNAKNQRNLRKIALEMWNAYAVATGLIDEPYLTRPEMERACLKHEDPAWIADLGRDPERAVQYMLDLARRLHARVAPPLKPLAETQTIEWTLPPYHKPAPWILLPGPWSAVPELPKRTRHSSPELFDLYFRYAQPFYASLLPKTMLKLGMRQPSVALQAESLRFQYHGQVLRYPGLMSANSRHALTTAQFAADAVERLTAGELYDEPPLPGVKPLPAIPEYYRERFTPLTEQHAELWPRLRAVPGPESN